MVELEPMGERIVVIPDAPPEEIRGIARPESAVTEVQSGVVESMGPLAEEQLPGVTPGVRVFFPFYSGITVDVEGRIRRVFVPSELIGHLPEGSSDAAV